MTVAALLSERFVARTDAKAWQTSSGYARDDSPLTLSDIELHLAGERHPVTLTGPKGPYTKRMFSLGHYLVDPATQTCKLFAFDIDLTKVGSLGGEPIAPREVFADPANPDRLTLLTRLKCLAYGLGLRTHKLTDGETQVAAAFSGNKGLHVYGLIPGGAPAADARAMGNDVLESFGYKPTRGENFWTHPTDNDTPNVCIEVYPKQDDVNASGYGNLMRLPLGVNGSSGKAGAFIRLDDGPARMTRMDPLAVLQGGELPWR